MAVVVSLAITGSVLVVLSTYALRVAGLSRVQISADAAALAGVIGGESAARQIAQANGVALCGYFVNANGDVSVRTCLGLVTARADARYRHITDAPTLTP